MNILIKRILKKGQTIDGTLYIDGVRICDCAENAESAISAGTYPVIRHKCKQYARFVPVILVGDHSSNEALCNCCETCEKLKFVCNNTTLPCVCPQIKLGNGIYNRADGSIIVGTRIVPGCMKHSKEPFENICERIRKLDGRGSEILLTIEEHYLPDKKHPTLYEACQDWLNRVDNAPKCLPIKTEV